MRSFPGFFRMCKLVFPLFFAAPLLGGAVVLAQNAPAQDASDALPPAGPPPPAVFQNRIPTAELAFLNDYAGRTPRELARDKRFRSVLKKVTPRTVYHYGRDMDLSETIDIMLDGAPLPIDVREGRYVMIASHGGLNIRGRGFVWFDIKEGIGLGGVFFAPINGEPSPTLAVFSRQLNQNTLAMSQLPDAFAEDVAQWAAVSAVPRIATRYFIPDDGKKYVLVHDEDYCWSGPNTPAPDQEACEQKNAEAAEIDMNAAYFMQESHNAANATAWRLGPDQVSWIGIRDQSCGFGAAGLPCRIRITRRRTRLLLGQHS